MFIAALFTIAKRWKEPRCPSMDKWINKMPYVCTMEYYSVLNRNKILIHATIGMNPEDIIQIEISQSQKDKYCMILLMRGT